MAVGVASRSTQADSLVRGWCHDWGITSDDVITGHLLVYFAVSSTPEWRQACHGCNICVLGGWSVDRCQHLSLLWLTDSTQTRSVCAGHRKYQGPRAEEASPLRREGLDSSAQPSCLKITCHFFTLFTLTPLWLQGAVVLVLWLQSWSLLYAFRCIMRKCRMSQGVFLSLQEGRAWGMEKQKDYKDEGK